MGARARLASKSYSHQPGRLSRHPQEQFVIWQLTANLRRVAKLHNIDSHRSGTYELETNWPSQPHSLANFPKSFACTFQGLAQLDLQFPQKSDYEINIPSALLYWLPLYPRGVPKLLFEHRCECFKVLIIAFSVSSLARLAADFHGG